ncbi:MAG: hypothetical protein FIA92_04400 [Chloroflexi bacterium]|nr:hypothetical protein [Chloroflexota bacterium]
MTKIGSIIEARDASYAAVARRAHLQARTVRMLATGETPIDRVAVGTIRRIANALEVPVALLLEDEPVHPGDPSSSRADRLAAAIRDVMWARQAVRYPSPLESGAGDDIADVTPDEFFGGMPTVDARRG